MKKNKSIWDSKFIGLAEHISSWSKDPSTKVGAVITDKDNRIVSVGYNGFPRGVKDDGRLDDRSEKLEMIVHGEMNAIIFAQRSLKGCTLYTYPFQPCSRCASMIVQSGIDRVVSLENKNDRWKESFERSSQIFQEAGVELHLFQTE